MKKNSLVLFLLVLFASAFAKSSETFIQQAEPATAFSYQHSVDQDTSYIVPDIELTSFGTHSSAQVITNLLKAPGYFPFLVKERSILFVPSFCIPDFSQIQPCENAYLSHNYPSHNFW